MKKSFREYNLNFFECCINHCRDWSETHDGKYPPSDHSPGCKNFKPEPFSRIQDPEGGVMLVPECESGNAIEEMRAMWPDEADKVKVAGTVMLTADQAMRLPEYEP